MDTQIKNTRDKDFWRRHVEQSSLFSGTVAQYCLENGLTKSVLYSYRQKYGVVGQKKKRCSFAKVTPKISLIEAAPVERKRELRLPDPKWVAALLMALGGGEQ